MKLRQIFKGKKSKENICKKEINKKINPETLDKFYGVDSLGNPLPELRIEFNPDAVEFVTAEKGKTYILKGIGALETEVSIYSLMMRLEKSKDLQKDFNYLFSLWLMQALRRAWQQDAKEVDITFLCNKEYFWHEGRESGMVTFNDLKKALFIAETNGKTINLIIK